MYYALIVLIFVQPGENRRYANLETYNWLMGVAAVCRREGLSCALTTSGVLSAMTRGTITVQMLSATSLDLMVYTQNRASGRFFDTLLHISNTCMFLFFSWNCWYIWCWEQRPAYPTGWHQVYRYRVKSAGVSEKRLTEAAQLRTQWRCWSDLQQYHHYHHYYHHW